MSGAFLLCTRASVVIFFANIQLLIILTLTYKYYYFPLYAGRFGPLLAAQRAVAAPGARRSAQGERAHQQHRAGRQRAGRGPAVVLDGHPHSKPRLRALRVGALFEARPVCLLRVPQQGVHLQETRLAVRGPGRLLHGLRPLPHAARVVLQPANLEPDCQVWVRRRGSPSDAQTPSGGNGMRTNVLASK